MKKSKNLTKHSLVERGRIAARLLVEGVAIEEVATRCNLNQELALQLLIKVIADCQGQLAERLAIVQRLHQTLADQLGKGVAYPTVMALIDPIMFRPQTVDEPPPKKQRKWFTLPPQV